jgi:hypothetical protein
MMMANNKHYLLFFFLKCRSDCNNKKKYGLIPLKKAKYYPEDHLLGSDRNQHSPTHPADANAYSTYTSGVCWWSQ